MVYVAKQKQQAF